MCLLCSKITLDRNSREQFFLSDVIISDSVIGYFVGNTLWLIAIGYYIYVTFLGYSGKYLTERKSIMLVYLS